VGIQQQVTTTYNDAATVSLKKGPATFP